MAADWTWLYRTGLTAGLLLAVWPGGESFAQEPTPSIAVPGFPIVTGFSGSRLGAPTPPPGVDTVEKVGFRSGLCCWVVFKALGCGRRGRYWDNGLEASGKRHKRLR
jgi:hypothetical protein